MGYFDIIKYGFKLANKNLMALLMQFLSAIAAGIAAISLAVAFIFMSAGSLSHFDLKTFDPADFSRLITASFFLVSVLVGFVFIFILIITVITAYVQAGNLGCILSTARGESDGFTFSRFFHSANRSFFSLTRLYILMFFISVGAAVAFVAGGFAGYEFMLLPLKEAGRQLLAFAIGVPFIAVFIILAIVAVLAFLLASVYSNVILVAERAGAFHTLRLTYGFLKENLWDALLYTLLVFVLVIAGSIVTEVLSIPFHKVVEKRNFIAMLGLLPLQFVIFVISMYLGLIAQSCFAAFYVIRTTPEPQPEAAPVQEEALEEPLEGDILEEPDDPGAVSHS